LDDDTVHRADIIAVDSRAQSQAEAGDLIQTFGQDEEKWSAVLELTDIVAGRATGRANESQITLFKSNGIAIWDVAVAARVYEQAAEQGRGIRLPLWEHCG
ncbi:MAG TPA: ornithine cyclodeaminase family protein, partial [Candidatus Nitrosotenuis sp.]|nr:ornithine cyclodeaminase family protein [Candidatus Nitrosotenuis sp.]